MKIKLIPCCRFALASAAMLLNLNNTHADIVYVWSNDGTIKRIDAGGVLSLVTSNNVEGWNGPVGLALDNVGNLYAGVPSSSSIFRFSPDGTHLMVGFTDSVSGLAFDSTGQLYITIPNFETLGRLKWVGAGYSVLDVSNSTTSNLRNAVALSFDSVGNIYVSSGPHQAFPPFPQTYTNTIQKFAPNFTDLGTFATNLNNPWGLAFDNADNLYVSNCGTNGVLSNTIARFNKQGVLSIFADDSNGLSSPRGVAFDSAGNLYVASYGSDTIMKFSPDGIGSVFAAGLNSPTSIAIFPGLNVWSATVIKLTNPRTQPNGAFQFDFIDNPGLTFEALATTNASLAVTNWTTLSGVMELSPGFYKCTDPQATNWSQRFYRILAR